VNFTGDHFGWDAAALIDMLGLDDDFTGTNRDTIATPLAALGVDNNIQNLVSFD
jgi:hypothetical protein